MAKRWAVGESAKAVPPYLAIDKGQTEALTELQDISSTLVNDAITAVPGVTV